MKSYIYALHFTHSKAYIYVYRYTDLYVSIITLHEYMYISPCKCVNEGGTMHADMGTCRDTILTVKISSQLLQIKTGLL